MIRTTALTALVTAGLIAGQASAAITAVSLDASNNIIDVTLNGDTYSVGSLTGITLTSYVQNSNDATLIIAGGDPTPTAGNRVNDTLYQANVASGLANVKTGTAFEFNAPVVNNAGDDFFIIEASGNDAFSLTLNATEVDYASGDWTALAGGISRNIFPLSDDGTAAGNPVNLTELEDASFVKFGGGTFSLPTAGLGIDLSDFGIAPGASFSGTVTFSSSSGLDPIYIAAIPEPASLALLGLGGLCLLPRRRA